MGPGSTPSAAPARRTRRRPRQSGGRDGNEKEKVKKENGERGKRGALFFVFFHFLLATRSSEKQNKKPIFSLSCIHPHIKTMFVVKEGLGLSSVFSSHEGEPVAAASTWWKQQLQHQHQRFRSLSSSTGFASLTASSSNSAPVSPHSSSSFVPPLPRGKKESRTGTDFPADYCHIVKKACPVLTGVGYDFCFFCFFFFCN